MSLLPAYHLSDESYTKTGTIIPDIVNISGFAPLYMVVTSHAVLFSILISK